MTHPIDYEGLIERLNCKSLEYKLASKKSLFPENRDRFEATAIDYDQAVTAIRTLMEERNKARKLVPEAMEWNWDEEETIPAEVKALFSEYYPQTVTRQALNEEG